MKCIMSAMGDLAWAWADGTTWAYSKVLNRLLVSLGGGGGGSFQFLNLKRNGTNSLFLTPAAVLAVLLLSPVQEHARDTYNYTFSQPVFL